MRSAAERQQELVDAGMVIPDEAEVGKADDTLVAELNQCACALLVTLFERQSAQGMVGLDWDCTIEDPPPLGTVSVSLRFTPKEVAHA